MAVVERLLGSVRRGTLLEIGCGTGIHLRALAPSFERVIGTDISPQMIARGRRDADASGLGARIELRVDPGERLATVAGGAVDAVLCVGALEHMRDKPRVLAQVRRVLRDDGTFVCLTPNGGYCWYRTLAPRLGLETRHLSSDRFLDARELQALSRAAGLEPRRIEPWRFVPRADMPAGWGRALGALDTVGRAARIRALRGGLALAARPVPSGARPAARRRAGLEQA
ncbi:MAG: hypothetical protein QOJ46_784 [bacterium]